MAGKNHYFTIKCKSNNTEIKFESETDAIQALSTFDGKHLRFNYCTYWIGLNVPMSDLYIEPIKRKTISFADALNGVLFERRKYGRGKTFCWAYIPQADGDYFSCGDPYPAVTFKKSVLIEVIKAVMASHPEYFTA
jgi:hypothetical protein